MDTNAGVFKISKISYIFTDFLEETTRNKKFFLDWSSVSMFNCYIYENKQSFYSFDVCKRIERKEEIDRLINKVLIPLLYYSISEYQNQSSKIGITMYGDGTIIDYSFFIFSNFFNPCEDVYKNLICLHKEGYSRHFDFSNTSENLRDWFDNDSFYSLLHLITYYSFTVNKTLNFSITFKDTELLENINYYVNCEMGIGVIRPCPRNTDNKINTVQTFKSNECVICLTNQPNVLFCNCGHIAICEECDRVKSLNTCPICKTKSTIKRMVE